jgi:putative NADPH-quinone reductase
MKVYILLAHPSKISFNGALADAYEQKAKELGHEVRRQNLGDMDFDPILWERDKTIQELEPDLIKAQENILWCQKWVIFYPIWWGSVPALLKGFIDRTLHSGFAYKYHDSGPFWDKLLKGRSAHLITTCDAPWFWIYFMYRNSDINMMKQATLKFCGFDPVKTTRLDRIRNRSKKELDKFVDKIRNVV